MNKIHIFLLAALIIAALGCGGGRGSHIEEDADGIMTMTTSAERVIIRLQGIGTATIDWGDGSQPETVEIAEDTWSDFRRDFADASQRTVTITGENITGLTCRDNHLTAIDVSRYTALERLICETNMLTVLDVSRNTALKQLWCGRNQIAQLDLSQNVALEYLECNDNRLIALDVRSNIALLWLDCSGNQLSQLTMGNNAALEEFRCGNNQLTELDVSNNTAIVRLWCENNQFTAQALNVLFEMLHDNTVEMNELEGIIGSHVDISNNPGSADCDPEIARAKGWWVAGFEGMYVDPYSEYQLIGNTIGFFIYEYENYATLDTLNNIEIMNDNGSIWRSINSDILEYNVSDDDFRPWAYEPGIGILTMRSVGQTENGYMIVAHEQRNTIKLFKHHANLRFYTVEGFVVRAPVVQVDFRINPVRESPNDNASIISVSSFEALTATEMNGEWVKIYDFIEDNVLGWVRWKKDDRFMLHVFFSM